MYINVDFDVNYRRDAMGIMKVVDIYVNLSGLFFRGLSSEVHNHPWLFLTSPTSNQNVLIIMASSAIPPHNLLTSVMQGLFGASLS